MNRKPRFNNVGKILQIISTAKKESKAKFPPLHTNIMEWSVTERCDVLQKVSDCTET